MNGYDVLLAARSDRVQTIDIKMKSYYYIKLN